MSRIVITVPIGMEKDLYNALQYIAAETDYVLLSADMMAKELKILPNLRNKSLTELRLLSGATDDMKAFFEEENVIYIGQAAKDSRYDKFIILFPDIIEAQEELIETQYNYKKYFLCSEQADFKTNSIAEIIKYVDSTTRNQGQEKRQLLN